MSALPHLDHSLRNIDTPTSDVRVPSLRRSSAIIMSPAQSKRSEVALYRCPKTNVIIHAASSIEHNAHLLAFADRNVVRVREQAARIRWCDADGVSHTHVLDAIIETADGRAIGVLVKPSETAVKHGLDDFVRTLAAQTPSSVAYRLIPMTERHMPEDEVRTAELFDSVRRDPRTHVDDELALIASEFTDETAIADITQRLGGGRVAFRPVVRSIFYGTLDRLTAGLITPNTIVRYSGRVMPDLDKGGPQVPPDVAMSVSAPSKSPKFSKGTRRFSYRAR